MLLKQCQRYIWTYGLWSKGYYVDTDGSVLAEIIQSALKLEVSVMLIKGV